MNLEHLIITSPQGLAIVIPPVGLDSTYQLECTDVLTWTLKKGSSTYELIGQKPDIKLIREVIICERDANFERYHEIRVIPQDCAIGSFSL